MMWIYLIVAITLSVAGFVAVKYEASVKKGISRKDQSESLSYIIAAAIFWPLSIPLILFMLVAGGIVWLSTKFVEWLVTIEIFENKGEK